MNCFTRYAGYSNSEYRNCIIYYSNKGTNTSTYYNNLHLTNDTTQCKLTSSNATNREILNTDERVKYLTADYSDSNTYELTDSVRALVTGTDGKEVGIYGGDFPYDETPTNPQITKFNVSPHTTTDGKLNVDIEVYGAQ